METEKEIANRLLAIGAVFLRPQEPFTWASGIRSPIYCDNRLILSDTENRKAIENALADLIKREYGEVELLAGTSTAGIPHAAFAAALLDLPMVYVRSGAKDHGRENAIEGRVQKGQKVVVIEDLISTAGSVVAVVEALRAAGTEVLGIASIFTYGMQKGLCRLEEAGVRNVSLTNFDRLSEVAVERGDIRASDLVRIKAFRDNPDDPAWVAL